LKTTTPSSTNSNNTSSYVAWLHYCFLNKDNIS
jgi:hypothetical protein